MLCGSSLPMTHNKNKPHDTLFGLCLFRRNYITLQHTNNLLSPFFYAEFIFEGAVISFAAVWKKLIREHNNTALRCNNIIAEIMARDPNHEWCDLFFSQTLEQLLFHIYEGRMSAYLGFGDIISHYTTGTFRGGSRRSPRHPLSSEINNQHYTPSYGLQLSCNIYNGFLSVVMV